MGGEPTSWRGTGPLRSRGHKGAMWLWKVHFRIHKHPLPVCLNASLSVYCMYRTFQTDRQTGHIWGATNGRPSPFPSSLSVLPACHPTQRGEVVRLEWLARRGQLCDHRPLSVCVWEEGGIHRPYYRPNYTLGLTNSYFTASSSHRAAAETLQDLYCDSIRMHACVILSTNQTVFNVYSKLEYITGSFLDGNMKINRAAS